MDTERFWCPECESVQLADGFHDCRQVIKEPKTKPSAADTEPLFGERGEFMPEEND